MTLTESRIPVPVRLEASTALSMGLLATRPNINHTMQLKPHIKNTTYCIAPVLTFSQFHLCVPPENGTEQEERICLVLSSLRIPQPRVSENWALIPNNSSGRGNDSARGCRTLTARQEPSLIKAKITSARVDEAERRRAWPTVRNNTWAYFIDMGKEVQIIIA